MKKVFIFLLFSITITFSQTWEKFTTENSDLPFNSIDNIVIDSNDNLWIYTNNSIFMYNSNEDKWTEFNENNSNLTGVFNYIEIGNDGSVYISSNNIYKFDKNKMNFDLILENINCDKFVFDNDKKILYYVNGLYVYKREGNNSFHIYNGSENGPNYPSNLIIDDNDFLWFGTDGFTNALYSFNGNNLEIYDSIFKVNGYLKAQKIIYNQKNTIWIGNGDLSILYNYDVKNNNWNFYDSKNSPIGKKGMFSKSFTLSSNNEIWLLSSNDVISPPLTLYKFNGFNWNEFSIDKAFDISAKDKFALLSLAVDSKNNVWIGTNQGLIKFNEAKTTVSTFEENNIKLYPNPTNDILYIDLSDKNVLSYSITDITGKILKQDFHNFTKQITIDTKSLTAGTHFIKLNLSDNHTIQSKFVKE